VTMHHLISTIQSRNMPQFTLVTERTHIRVEGTSGSRSGVNSFRGHAGPVSDALSSTLHLITVLTYDVKAHAQHNDQHLTYCSDPCTVLACLVSTAFRADAGPVSDDHAAPAPAALPRVPYHRRGHIRVEDTCLDLDLPASTAFRAYAGPVSHDYAACSTQTPPRSLPRSRSDWCQQPGFMQDLQR
jgi:hypothetical protein